VIPSRRVARFGVDFRCNDVVQRNRARRDANPMRSWQVRSDSDDAFDSCDAAIVENATDVGYLTAGFEIKRSSCEDDVPSLPLAQCINRLPLAVIQRDDTNIRCSCSFIALKSIPRPFKPLEFVDRKM